jgi:hypothetical protein
MAQFKKLPTGIYIMSTKGGDGVIRYTSLNQKQYNKMYLRNVWWSKTKEFLNKLNIITWEEQNH